jgi:hypothetical protein
VIKDEDGCEVALPRVEIPQGSGEYVDIVSVTVIKQPTCHEDDGIIRVDVVGGSIYEYYIAGITPDWTLLDTSGLIGSLPADNYTVLVRLAGGGCEDASHNITLTNPISEEITIEAPDVTHTDCDTNSGSVTFDVTGIATPFDYSIDGVSGISTTGTVSASGLTIGDHTFLIYDEGGCVIGGGSFTVGSEDPNDFTFNVTGSVIANCGELGELEIAITEPDDVVGLEYRINGGFWKGVTDNTMVFTYPAGDYAVELRSSAMCVSIPQSDVIENKDTPFTIAEPEGFASTCGLNNGYIWLTITPAGTYQYSMDGGKTYDGVFDEPDYTISGLYAGFYDIMVKDADGCEMRLYDIEVPQGLGNDILAAPEATTPQTFCDGAQVKNLQAKGTGIVWYDADGNLLDKDDLLTTGVYYAAQTTESGCEGKARTMVKVIIDDNVFIDKPNMPYEIEMCIPATLAEVPTNGNTNIVWFDQMTGGTEILDPSMVDIISDTTFYAAIKYGDGATACYSAQRAEVNIIVVTEIGPPEDVETPQHFCDGALVENLAAPHDQIIWYLLKPSDGGIPLEIDARLIEGIYYAAQKMGDCETEEDDFVEVEVILDQYPAPTAPPQQCINKVVFISDLMIIGASIKWYDDEFAGSEYTDPTSTPVVSGTTYYAAQTNGDCESERTPVYVTDECYSPKGTVFPFVHTGDNTFDEDFVVTARLYSKPPDAVLDKLGYVLKQSVVIQTKQVKYYDCTKDAVIIGAPRNPGVIGSPSNPGLPMNWSEIGNTSVTPTVYPTLTPTNPCTIVPIGWFEFEDITPNDYIIEISRQGFVTRYGVVQIYSDAYLGHREILGGDLNKDMFISEKDVIAIRSKMGKYGDKNYSWTYNLNGDDFINSADIGIINVNFGAHSTIYQETECWLNPTNPKCP